MIKEHETLNCHVSWWLWNGNTFELHELEVEPVEIAKCSKYRFFRIANPVKNPKPGREWIIAEGGTGYVLAYGSDALEVLKVARGRFRFEREGIRAADVMQYIQAHLMLVERYVGDLPGFVAPVAGANIRPTLVPVEVLIAQMI